MVVVTMIKGDTVTIKRTVDTGEVDAHNSPIYTVTTKTVDNVLISPRSREDVIDSNRPDGVRLGYQLHFPKSFIKAGDADLTGALIVLTYQGFTDECKVIGAPRPYQLQNTPGDWCMPVEVEVVYG